MTSFTSLTNGFSTALLGFFFGSAIFHMALMAAQRIFVFFSNVTHGFSIEQLNYHGLTRNF